MKLIIGENDSVQIPSGTPITIKAMIGPNGKIENSKGMIGPNGSIVIPKDAMKKLGLKKGSTVDITL